MSAPWGSRPGRSAGRAVRLPCGHEIALEGSPLLIEMSAAILEHQRGCSPRSLGSVPSPWDSARPTRELLPGDLPDLL
jgi:hypothetical protein